MNSTSGRVTRSWRTSDAGAIETDNKRQYSGAQGMKRLPKCFLSGAMDEHEIKNIVHFKDRKVVILDFKSVNIGLKLSTVNELGLFKGGANFHNRKVFHKV